MKLLYTTHKMSIHENDNYCNYDKENSDNDDTHRSSDIYDISRDDNYIMVTKCSRIEVNSRINCRTKVHRMIPCKHLIQRLTSCLIHFYHYPIDSTLLLCLCTQCNTVRM